MDDTTISELRAEIEALRAEVAELRDGRDRAGPTPPRPGPDHPTGAPPSRRALLGGIGAAGVVGAVAGLSRPAGAASGTFDGDPAISAKAMPASGIGVEAVSDTGTAVQAGAAGPGGRGVVGTAASGSGFGVMGVNDATDDDGAGVYGLNTAGPWGVGVRGQAGGTDGTGVLGSGTRFGVRGQASTATGVGVSGEGLGGPGVRGMGTTGVEASSVTSNGRGVAGSATGPWGIGVLGEGTYRGVSAHSSTGAGLEATSSAANDHAIVAESTGADGTGVKATGTTYGVQATAGEANGVGVYAAAAQLGVLAHGTGANGTGVLGMGHGAGSGVIGQADKDAVVGWASAGGAGLVGRSGHHQLRLDSTDGPGPPLTSGVAHVAGELIFDPDRALWVCVGSGVPGTWIRLAAPDTAGGLVVLASAVRAYDSRPGYAPTSVVKGTLSAGQERTVDLTVGGGLPAGVRGALLNVTVTGTSTAGFLKLYRPGAAVPSASAINWDHAESNVANNATVAPDAAGGIVVRCGGSGAVTHVIVDVVGYYR